MFRGNWSSLLVSGAINFADSQQQQSKRKIEKVLSPKGQLILKANCQAVNSSEKGTNEFISTKGQTKSKLFFQAYISSKKQTNEFNFTTMRLFFVRFLEEIEDTKKTYQN